MSYPTDHLVVHWKRAPYDVLITRDTKWGNPYRIGPDGTRAEVIEKHILWLPKQRRLVRALPELRGKVLGCWCSEGQRCHGHYLAWLANQPRGLFDIL